MVSPRRNLRHKVAESYLINLEGEYGPWVYQSCLQRERKNHAWLTSNASGREDSQILGMASLLNQLCGDVVISHPQTGVKCVINQHIDPKSCYLLSSGDYNHDCISLINTYITQGDCVGILGGGVGLLPVVVSTITQKTTYVWEPYKGFHSVISKNARINEVAVELCQNIIDLQSFKSKINIVVDLSKQDRNFFQNVCLTELDSIIVFRGDNYVEEKFVAQFISEIMRRNFSMDTRSNGVYVFLKA
jgi:hypothetical protein